MLRMKKVLRKPRRRRMFTRKKCAFCTRKISRIDYKDVDTLRQFVTEHGKILTRKITGTCAKHQRKLVQQIKRARYIALLPFGGG
jgi:small subunit ribosomal protein S18